MDKGKKIISWILLLGWMAFIFYMSGKTGEESSSQSGTVIKILSTFGFTISKAIESNVTFIIRKGAHVTEYLILYLLLFNVIKNYVGRSRTAVLSIILLVIYAASDEIHQYFVPGRSAAFVDVMIDSCGGIIGLMINKLYYKAKNDR